MIYHTRVMKGMDCTYVLQLILEYTNFHTMDTYFLLILLIAKVLNFGSLNCSCILKSIYEALFITQKVYKCENFQDKKMYD